ncbi:sugar ABC transporter ATP-binding protein [Pseudomonas sp. MPC6]|uniref:sugar ABC transporter ATP-binding protein n=1 Tax=unclassified Pseudomonas TaxID=196821 RepID=UPI001110B0AA|nr:sugar ABC transporter ATP-binding protein [Pseudomonas sp. MPC6]QCY13333.1 sugar ABC transporter ATP-binding protein [Pseudomonas sp. MPC6]
MLNTGSESPPPALLEMRAISKSFNGVRVLHDIDLSIFPGQIHALMGENGAGKSTLMKILSGAYIADSGTIRIDGCDIRHYGLNDAKRHGISVIYQELSLCANMSVVENIYLGREIRRCGVINHKAMTEGAQVVLKRLGVTFDPHALVATLSIADQQLVEIARAIHADTRILVMDEPTTPLSSKETESLFTLIRQLRDEGVAIIYISHRMAEIYALSDFVSVLRDGHYVGSLDRGTLSAETLVRMMVGRDVSGFYAHERASCTYEQPILRVRNLTDGYKIKDCSFELYAGEILGIAGLVGSGRTELARLIAGIDAYAGGHLELDGEVVAIRSPRDAGNAGIAYLTEDRKALGLFLDMSVHDNINVCVLGSDASLTGVVDRSAGTARVKQAIQALNIKASPDINVGALSGGNQQKVLLARLLEMKPRVLFLDEPTSGVDIGAKTEIYKIINALAASGVCVVMISSELPEIVGIADRVLVMCEGKLVAELGGRSGLDITPETIIAFATGSDSLTLANGDLVQ